MYLELPVQTELLAKEIVDIALKIHMKLGPGLQERVYEKCFCYELTKRGIDYQCQKDTPIVYDELIIDEGLRLDILVDNQVVVELKAQENFHPVREAQLLSYLKLTDKRLGFLVNFHVPVMKNGIRRIIR